MMSFLGRWLSNAWILSLSFAAALLLMQAPALTDAYMAALLQVASDARGDIDQRLASARQYYQLAGDERQILEALRAREPSNAETLLRSMDRAAVYRAAYERLASTAPILRPAVALGDALADPTGYKRKVIGLLFTTFVPALQLSMAALAYAVLGVLAGTLVGHAFVSLLRLATPGRARHPAAARNWYVPASEPGATSRR